MNTILNIEKDIKTLDVSSSAFTYFGYIPEKYTCYGENISPPITIEKIPEDTKSLVLIADDPDAPIRTWTHWLVWNIPPVKNIKENSIPGIEGVTDFLLQEYSGPCPPSGIHHYHFKVYALDSLLNLSSAASRIEVEKKMGVHILAFGELVGLYKSQWHDTENLNTVKK